MSKSPLKDAISVLENYGRHHPWCPTKTRTPVACECGILNHLADLRRRARLPISGACPEPERCTAAKPCPYCATISGRVIPMPTHNAQPQPAETGSSNGS